MRTLLEGSKGPEVLQIQRMLNRAEPRGITLKEDSIFGPKTKARVVEFQKSARLKADGIVGEITGSVLARSHVPANFETKALEASAAWSRTVLSNIDRV